MLNSWLIEQHKSTHTTGVVMTDTTLANKAVKHYQRIMGLTHAEFERSLPYVVPKTANLNKETAGTFRIDENGRVAHIRNQTIADYRLGSLRMPRLKVDIELHGFTTEQSHKFLLRFDTIYLHMGG